MEYKEAKGMTHNTSANLGAKCFAFGVFTPPVYAKRIGDEEMQKYLKEADQGQGFFKK